MLAQDLRANVAKAQARQAGRAHTDPVADSTVLLAFSGLSLGGSPQGLLDAAVAKAETVMQTTRAQASPQRAFQAHQWSPVLDAMNAWTGQLRVRCCDPEEAVQLHARLNKPRFGSERVGACSNGSLLASTPPSHPGNGHRRSTGQNAAC